MSTVKLNKKLCYVLRHNPVSVGLFPDDDGYVSVDDLITKFNDYGVHINKATLEEIVCSDKKERFSFSTDKTKIRANYGHSFAVDLNLTPLCPPAVLYHGTTERNAESILASGLNKAKRNYVHLTDDLSTAIKVGERHGNPVIFRIDSGKMFKDGYIFYKSGGITNKNKPSRGDVWLADNVPKEYLSLYGIKVEAIP